jgi:hypothetical protein
MALPRSSHEAGVTIATSGTIEGVPKTQTPSQAEHGPGGPLYFYSKITARMEESS